jgi:hypothetical protein
MQAAGASSASAIPLTSVRLFVELTERSKALEDRAACLGPAVFGDAGNEGTSLSPA